MEKLGVEPVMLLTQVINFTIMVIILTKFLYKPILKMLDDRRKKIEEGLRFSQEMQVKEEALKAEKEKVIDKAKSEGQKIIQEHKDLAKKKEVEILNEANEEARTIKEKAKADLDDERQKMREELNKEVITIALALTKKVLGQYLDKKTQGVIIEKKLAELERQRIHAAK